MSSDLGSNGPDSRARPDFLPPEQATDDEPRWAEEEATADEPGPAREPEPRSQRSGAWCNIAVIISAAGLLVSAFLPWVRAQVTVDAFDQTVVQDLGDAAGIEVDTMVVVVPVLALAAVAMAFWGLVTRDARVSSLTAIPGALAVLTCGVFLVRLGDARDELSGRQLMPFDISPAYGWYVAVATALLVFGFGLLRPLVSRKSPGGAAASDRAASP
jgi:hypothetical protein